MKVKILLIVLLFSAINIFAQNTNDNKDKSLINDVNTSKDLSDSLISALKTKDLTGFTKFLSGKKNLESDKNLDRQLVATYFEFSFGIRNAPGYKIDLLCDGNKIIYAKLSSARKKKFEEKDSSAMKQFTHRFTSFFQAKIKIADLFADTVYYGSGCGFTGSDPPLRKKLNALVSAGNTKELQKWLQSPLTEKQLYGVDGFITMEKKGYNLSAFQKKLIDFIKIKKGQARVCGGSEHANKEIAKIFEEKK